MFDETKTVELIDYVCMHVVRFIVYKAGGHHQFTSLVETFTRELMRSPPDLLVIGGLRQLIGAESVPGKTCSTYCAQL